MFLMFLKQIFVQEAKYTSFKNIKFPRGNYQTNSTSSEASLLFTTKFSSVCAAVEKSYQIISNFLMMMMMMMM